MEELALRLTHCDRWYRNMALDELREGVRSLIAIAYQIGMSAVSAIARHATSCIGNKDHIALAATLARLLRIGEESLVAILDLQDVTI